MSRVILIFLLLCCVQTAAAEMGRLFFTPAERAKLDELRANAKSVDITDLQQPETVIQAPPSDISVQGYVKRSDGKKSTIWVNGQPVQEDSSGVGVEVGKIQSGSNQVPLTLPGSGKSVKLKAGQTYDPASDQVTEVKAGKGRKPSEDTQENGVTDNAPLSEEVLEKIRELKRK